MLAAGWQTFGWDNRISAAVDEQGGQRPTILTMRSARRVHGNHGDGADKVGSGAGHAQGHGTAIRVASEIDAGRIGATFGNLGGDEVCEGGHIEEVGLLSSQRRCGPEG